MLKVDWATYEAARFACENWHYSKSIPCGKLVKVGAWESDRFVGVVLFGRGANNNLNMQYGLKTEEICELVRVALRKHRSPVTKIVSIAIRMLKKLNPNIRLIVSYADLDRGHTGKIYQAGNWTYQGLVNVGKSCGSFNIRGEKKHMRSFHIKGKKGAQSLDYIKKTVCPSADYYDAKGKHKYIMPLDDGMRRFARLVAKPYPPSAESIESDAAANPGSRGECNSHLGAL